MQGDHWEIEECPGCKGPGWVKLHMFWDSKLTAAEQSEVSYDDRPSTGQNQRGSSENGGERP